MTGKETLSFSSFLHASIPVRPMGSMGLNCRLLQEIRIRPRQPLVGYATTPTHSRVIFRPTYTTWS